ncbi:hypothetical protein BVY02_01605, partial [bacterium J17]
IINLRIIFSCLLCFFVLPAASFAENEKGLISHNQIIIQLVNHLGAKDDATRNEAGIALRSTAKREDVEFLVSSLRKGNQVEKQVFLIETLARIGDERAVPGLIFELEHGSREAKLAAITALGYIGSDQPIAFLTKIAKSVSDVEMSMRAISALGRIGSQRALYALENTSAKFHSKERESLKRATKWAIEYASPDFDKEGISTNLGPGRRMIRSYRGMRFYYYFPGTIDKDPSKTWLLVCVHDNDLDAKRLADYCWKYGRENRVAVLVPYFDNINYPEYWNFDLRSDRSDVRFLELVDYLSRYTQINNNEIYLFGLGKGAEFVQRFVLAYPDKVAKAASVLPDELSEYSADKVFPEGVGPTVFAPDIQIDLKKFIKTDIALFYNDQSAEGKRVQRELDALLRWANKKGMRSRIATRVSVLGSDAKSSRESGMIKHNVRVWDEAVNYLLEEN